MPRRTSTFSVWPYGSSGHGGLGRDLASRRRKEEFDRDEGCGIDGLACPVRDATQFGGAGEGREGDLWDEAVEGRRDDWGR